MHISLNFLFIINCRDDIEYSITLHHIKHTIRIWPMNYQRNTDALLTRLRTEHSKISHKHLHYLQSMYPWFHILTMISWLFIYWLTFGSSSTCIEYILIPHHPQWQTSLGKYLKGNSVLCNSVHASFWDIVIYFLHRFNN